MQTLTIQVKDDLVAEVMNALEKFKDNVKITKDKNLELDLYFYERQKKLQQIRDDIKSGKTEMLTQKQYDKEIEQFFEKLESKYAN
ncbi:hypothetical protein [Hydrogenimonas sp.]